MRRGRLMLGAALGGVAAMVAHAFGLAPLWAFLIGIGVALIIWLRLYRVDKLDIDIDMPNPFD